MTNNKKLTEIKNKWLFIWVLTCAILFFFAERTAISASLYTLFVMPLAIYLFPIKAVITIYKQKNVKTIVLLCLSYYVMGWILSSSAILFFVPEFTLLATTQQVFLFVNAGLAFYHLFIRDDKEIAFLHFMFCLFV